MKHAFVADAHGRIIETNPLFQGYTGRPAADLEGDRWLEALHGEDRARAAEAWCRAVATGGTYEARHRFRRHDGEYRRFACRGVPEREEDGRVGFVDGEEGGEGDDGDRDGEDPEYPAPAVGGSEEAAADGTYEEQC